MRAKTTSWIIQPESSDGPLDSEQVQTLAQSFDLSEADLRGLSRALAHPLSDRFMARGVLKPIMQMEKGASELEKLINELRQAEARLAKAAALYSQIQVQYLEIERGTDDPNVWYKSALDHALQNVKIINRSLARSSTKYSARFTGEPDKRRLRDERRAAVLRVIFDSWHAAGRNVSITTDPLTSKRIGPLIDFANAVVRCLTDPVTEISGETVWQEIKKWRLSHQFIASSRLLKKSDMKDAAPADTV